VRSGSSTRPTKPIAAVARDLGVNEGTLGNWVARDREARQGTEGLSKGDIEELKQLRAENAELRVERDVLKRSVVLWVLSRCWDNTHYAEHRIMPSSVRKCLWCQGSVTEVSA